MYTCLPIPERCEGTSTKKVEGSGSSAISSVRTRVTWSTDVLISHGSASRSSFRFVLRSTKISSFRSSDLHQNVSRNDKTPADHRLPNTSNCMNQIHLQTSTIACRSENHLRSGYLTSEVYHLCHFKLIASRGTYALEFWLYFFWKFDSSRTVYIAHSMFTKSRPR